MRPITEIIRNRKTDNTPVWLMRQAGRYLPEFREIRSKNQNFIELCLNENLVPEITLQPLKRFKLDAAIIFSDILMLPYGLGQSVRFKKDFGPLLGNVDDIDLQNISYESFTKKINSVYKSMNKLSNILKDKKKNLIGFVGAPWTIMVYMLNQQSPKKELSKSLTNKKSKNDLINIIVKYLKIHIKEQINSGANLIQIFDSWAGLAESFDIKKYIYESTAELVEFTKSLNVPVICFPREINDYKQYVDEVSPDAINIDYNVDIKLILRSLKVPIQGGLDPKYLLGGKENLKKETLKLLDNFKDHPYIFNLGHGVLPQTDPNMVEYLVNTVKEF